MFKCVNKFAELDTKKRDRSQISSEVTSSFISKCVMNAEESLFLNKQVEKRRDQVIDSLEDHEDLQLDYLLDSLCCEEKYTKAILVRFLGKERKGWEGSKGWCYFVLNLLSLFLNFCFSFAFLRLVFRIIAQKN